MRRWRTGGTSGRCGRGAGRIRCGASCRRARGHAVAAAEAAAGSGRRTSVCRTSRGPRRPARATPPLPSNADRPPDTSPPRVAIEERPRLLQIGRVKVSRPQTLAAFDRDLHQIGRDPRQLRVAKTLPPRAIEHAEVGRAEEVGGGADGPGVVREPRGQRERRGVPLAAPPHPPSGARSDPGPHFGKQRRQVIVPLVERHLGADSHSLKRRCSPSTAGSRIAGASSAKSR